MPWDARLACRRVGIPGNDLKETPPAAVTADSGFLRATAATVTVTAAATGPMVAGESNEAAIYGVGCFDSNNGAAGACVVMRRHHERGLCRAGEAVPQQD